MCFTSLNKAAHSPNTVQKPLSPACFLAFATSYTTHTLVSHFPCLVPELLLHQLCCQITHTAEADKPDWTLAGATQTQPNCVPQCCQWQGCDRTDILKGAAQPAGTRHLYRSPVQTAYTVIPPRSLDFKGVTKMHDILSRILEYYDVITLTLTHPAKSCIITQGLLKPTG